MQLIRKLWKLPRIIGFGFAVILTSVLAYIFPGTAVEIGDIDFIGQASLPTGVIFQKTELGGLSGITYDSKTDLYYAISDDRSQKSPARFYTLKIDLSNGELKQGGIVPVGVTTLLTENGKTFAAGKIDSEGIAITSKNTVFISSEGDAGQFVNPFIKEFSLTSGKAINTLSVPDKFLPSRDRKQGIRNNLAFESLTITPNEKQLFTASENALIQDGSQAKPNISTPCRILQYNLISQQPEKEFLYATEAVAPVFDISKRFAHGLPDLLALDNQGHFLSIERSFTGLGFSVALFQVSLEGATDISNIESISQTNLKTIKPVQKKLLLDLKQLDLLLDNIEGLTLGARLPDGNRSLILVSDNNFLNLQRTQILAFRLKIESPLMRLLRRLTPSFKP
ncbi:MAG: esterase-like activity of phytase family protein [Nostocaceae cyanobacterium]|nr:esterase-like activity of phytase family protein [Nostocaceae cyanobacterium]